MKLTLSISLFLISLFIFVILYYYSKDQQIKMSSINNQFPVIIPSDDRSYPNNRPNKFRVHLPRTLEFSGSWSVELSSISYSHSWDNLGTLNSQWLDLHLINGRQKIRVPIPSANYLTVEEIVNRLFPSILENIEKYFKMRDLREVEIIKLSKNFGKPPNLVTLNGSNKRKIRKSRELSQDSPQERNSWKRECVDTILEKSKDSLTIKSNDIISFDELSKVINNDNFVDQVYDPPLVEPNVTIPLMIEQTDVTNSTVIRPNNSVPLIIKYSDVKDLIVIKSNDTDPTIIDKNIIIKIPKIDVVIENNEEIVTPITDNLSQEIIVTSPSPIENTLLEETLFNPTTVVDVEPNKESFYMDGFKGENYDFPDDIANFMIRDFIQGLNLVYLNDTNKIKFKIKEENILNDFITYIFLSPQLGYILGFADPEKILPDEIAKYSADLKGGIDAFGVYSKGLTENIICGGELVSLLRIVTIIGKPKFGDTVQEIYNPPMYLRVLPKQVSEIEIELRTMSMDGRLMPFQYGVIRLVLLFKKVLNF